MTRQIILVLLLSASSAFAEDFRWATRPGGSCATGTDGLDEFDSEKNYAYFREGRNPDADEQKRLVVEWGKVSMGYLDSEDVEVDGALDQHWWVWKDDNALRDDRQLSIRGRLLIKSVDGKSRLPIDWLQGVRVVVSRLPDKKHDWSDRQEMHEAVWGEFVIEKDGEFLATIPPGGLRRSVGEESQFQVALSLAQLERAEIIWRNSVGVLPQSVTFLTIPGPPAVNETMQIINGAPSYEQENFNPAKLVRAVNHLMPMGKEKAIAELRSFLKIACDSFETVRDDVNIDTSDRSCVFLIVRLLFEPEDPTEERPDIAEIPFAAIPDDQDKKFWPLLPIHLQDDVPFFLTGGGGLGGAPDQPESHVDWAEMHGRIRTQPLRPLDHPMQAATRLIELPQTARLYEKDEYTDVKDLLYRQAWNIVEDADSRIPKPKPIAPADAEDAYPDWDARTKEASQLKIRWIEATD